MAPSIHLHSPGRVRVGALATLLLAVAPFAAPDAGAEEAPRLTYYPSLQLRFVGGQARNYFFSQAGVVNTSGTPMTSLTLRQKFPSGFTARTIPSDAQAVYKRPPGFTETLEGNVYTMSLPELRIAEATYLAVELTYEGRPGAVTFPGIEVEYTMGSEKRSEKAPDKTWDLSRYTRYSGTLREFIKRFADLEFTIPAGDADWGFSGLAARTAGKEATGVVEIDNDTGGRMRFSLQAGVPGSLRQMMVVRRPYNPERYPKANDEVRRLISDLVQSTAGYTLDVDDFSVQKQKLGRWEAWVAQTRWRDGVKDRLGEGPSRWYLFAEEKAGALFIINISAQGRGAGPGKADVANPTREKELMAELETIVSSLRLIL